MPHRLPVKLRLGLICAWIALVALASIPLSVGIRALREPARIMAEPFPARVPTTGPYTPQELQDAHQQIILFTSSTQPIDIPSDQLQKAAEYRRQIQRLTQQEWEAQRRDRVQAARSGRTGGLLLTAIGAIMILAFTYVALRIYRISATTPQTPLPSSDTPEDAQGER